MKTIIKPFILVLFLVALITLISLACNLPINQGEGLTINRNNKDGSVSGNYRTGGQLILFSVTADGLATFEIEKGSNAEKLIVDMRNDTEATLNWQGMDLDGIGDISADEQQTLQSLLVSQLAPGITMIALDAGCQGDEIIDDKQLAALLFPLQMQLKYIISDRTSKAMDLMHLSQCDYGLRDNESLENNTKNSSIIYFSPSNPIPVVLGYFPFDEEGAIAPNYSQESGEKFACLNPQPLLNVESEPFTSILYSFNFNGSAPIRDEFGPCQATCRGACGADCTTKNCTFESKERCEKDELGNNTGLSSIIHTYTCGVHPACIAHDDCYDECNQRHGCGTWGAAYCRHGGYGDPTSLLEPYINKYTGLQFFCDKITITDESISDVRGWVKGEGPKPLSQVYEYTDEIAKDMVDLRNCPPPDLEVQEEPPPPAPEPPEEQEPLEQPPATIEPQLVTAVVKILPCGDDYMTLNMEFWNVGEQGGDEYSMIDFWGFSCDHDVLIEEKHWYGSFTGGPDGEIKIFDSDLTCQIVEGNSVACYPWVMFDEAITLNLEILNPEAFDDWR
ncbi:MAG TPA: hypothetical protein VK856_12435 [Anaerolineaceae bacterium]|nr:hypothetical protein [Anaerolineaceae bacterium]